MWEICHLLCLLLKLRRNSRISVHSVMRASSLEVARFIPLISLLAVLMHFSFKFYEAKYFLLCRMLVFAMHLLNLKIWLVFRMQSRWICFVNPWYKRSISCLNQPKYFIQDGKKKKAFNVFSDISLLANTFSTRLTSFQISSLWVPFLVALSYFSAFLNIINLIWLTLD